ncbi:hypothetical protein HDV62DRAFT_49087 [Trichoderma sp. SZMC 28011]
MWPLASRCPCSNGAAGVTQARHDTHTHTREAGGPTADLLTVVRREMGWSHAAKTQQADGAGRGPNRLTAVRLTNRVWLSETLISSACSGPVVSVPVPFLLLFALCCLRACCAVGYMLYVLCRCLLRECGQTGGKVTCGWRR